MISQFGMLIANIIKMIPTMIEFAADIRVFQLPATSTRLPREKPVNLFFLFKNHDLAAFLLFY
jgi:hypothetical protein